MDCMSFVISPGFHNISRFTQVDEMLHRLVTWRPETLSRMDFHEPSRPAIYKYEANAITAALERLRQNSSSSPPTTPQVTLGDVSLCLVVLLFLIQPVVLAFFQVLVRNLTDHPVSLLHRVVVSNRHGFLDAPRDSSQR